MTATRETANAGLVFLLVVLSTAGATRGAPPKPSALFAFGDSYADTGNQVRQSSSWKYPSGITWPGYPTGRFGNGHVQTDYLADKLGLPLPTLYSDIANQSFANGVNFAIGGSGVTFAIGVLPMGAQVDQFESVLQTGAFSPAFLADAVALVSNVGNDYSVKYSNAEFLVVVQAVVEGMALALERLYNLGLRNMLVSNLPPINCFPGTVVQSNYTICEEYLVPLMELHNGLLVESVKKLNTLPNSNFLILDELAAFTYVLDNPEQYGIKETLLPCCKPLNASDNCGDMDPLGNHLYTLCDDPTSHVFWDTVHPVESTWKHVLDLFYNDPGFLIGATTLESWLYQNSLRSPAPAPGVEVPEAGALGQLEAALQALISKPDYAEALGLLGAINWEEHLAGVLDQTVTVFLPNNIALYTTPSSTIIHIYGQDQVVPVAEFHVVKGYFDSAQFSSSVQNLTTVSGLNLQTTFLLNQVLVGPGNALVVGPDLYKVEGQLVVHGINQTLIPPGLL